MEIKKAFPRTEVAGVSLPRILIGTNWILGYSHTSAAADRLIRDKYSDREAFVRIIGKYLEYGIDAIMGPISETPIAYDGIRYAEEKLQRKLIYIDTPTMNVSDTPEARSEAAARIKRSAEIGSTFCLMHHSSMEQLVNKNKGRIDRLPDYLYMTRENGLIPGLSAHMPEAIIYSDNNGYDVETYIQIFNCMGFMMQVEIEQVANIIWNAKKPVMTIKPFAAGRTTPFVGLNFNWNVLRECDMITVGALTEYEVEEDVEISFAALERRRPNLAGRSSPNTKQDILKK
jgi:hypothetical protein